MLFRVCVSCFFVLSSENINQEVIPFNQTDRTETVIADEAKKNIQTEMRIIEKGSYSDYGNEQEKNSARRTHIKKRDIATTIAYPDVYLYI